CVFSDFKSIPKAFPKHFCALGAFPRLPRRVFGVRECSQAFPGTFFAFGSILSQRDALLTEFWLARTARIFASQKPSKLARRIFSASNVAKNIQKEF
ncbi:MAG: hypothetical protein K2I74_04345, partial [Treponemataceae bacterium]|nr:hypothetical protein [Treponemataceae bacterium]